MEKRIQSGCIQTILFNGKLIKYRATLWIPEWYANEYPKDVEKIRKRYLFCPEDIDYDRLVHKINAAQVIIYQRQLIQLERKWMSKLNELSNYEAKYN